MFSKGSEWRKWDLHVHTPASLDHKYGDDCDATWEKYLTDLEKLPDSFKVLGINDYFFIDGYERILQEKAKGRLQNIDLILPVVEFRLQEFAGVQFGKLNRINLHVIFADEKILPLDQIKSQFLNTLDAKYILEKDQTPWNLSVTRKSVEDLGKSIKAQVPPNELNKYGSDLIEGFNNLNLSLDSILKSLEKSCFKDKYLIAIGKTEWDELKWTDGSIAVKKHLINSAKIVFTAAESYETFNKAKEKLINYGVNDLLLDCSDAHNFSDKTTDKDRIGNCFTWIKADPTFAGLVQATLEPQNRIYIGELPEKELIKQGKGSYFIDKIEISKKSSASSNHTWLDGTNLKLSHDLVAIIGKKGSGKSALADVISLLGNSKSSSKFFSFLKDGRFKGKGGFASDFEASLTWLNGTKECQSLDSNVDHGKAERVRYIPQVYFEKLCNPDQGDNEFQNELNSVIFSYLSEEDRNECTSLDTLIKFKESALNDHLSSLKLALSNLNTEIEDLEYQAQAGVKNILESKRQLKLQELQDHESIKPIEVKSPSEELTPEQQSLKAKMDANNLRQIELLGEVKKLNEQVVDNQRKIVISKQIIDKYEILKEQVQAFKEQISESLKVLSIDNDIVTFKIDTTKIVELIDSLNEENAENSLRIDSLNKEIETCNEVVKTVRGQLTEPLQRYNEYLENLRKWDNKKLELKGDNSSLDSLFGIQYQLELIEKLPEQLTQKRNDRKDISIKIFEVLESKKLIRESLYGPVQKAIEKNKFINEKNKFEFVSKLNFSTEHFQDELTNLIMQRRLEFTPDNIKKTLDELSKHEDLDTKEGCINFIEKLIAKLEEVNDATGIADMVKKNTKPKDGQRAE
ncbi:hypothetical protein ECE07_09435 [Acinetobacter pittii]|uniref:TrlF family AAA-like ATPase n=1 Tax=Acinetobacter pittii TaxID=48296 RepID=UPI00227D689E|nr:hypothetical protein [Acinetobacter pittii]MCY3228461.1 hypothetical protein [Acinetobacter pittii]